jgi:hypothetical protein
MRELAPAAQPLQVDVRLTGSVSLPQAVLEEAAAAATVLLRLSTRPWGVPAREGPTGALPMIGGFRPQLRKPGRCGAISAPRSCRQWPSADDSYPEVRVRFAGTADPC